MYSAESSLDALAEAGGDKSYKVKVRAPHAAGPAARADAARARRRTRR